MAVRLLVLGASRRGVTDDDAGDVAGSVDEGAAAGAAVQTVLLAMSLLRKMMGWGGSHALWNGCGGR